jgi:hypothetical protein
MGRHRLVCTHEGRKATLASRSPDEHCSSGDVHLMRALLALALDPLLNLFFNRLNLTNKTFYLPL